MTGSEGGRAAGFARAAWAVTGAFGTYFCMYGFRKPFTAAPFAGTVFGLAEKDILVIAQVLGYLVSKFVGVRVVAGMPPARRAAAILGLLAAAEAAFVLFGLVPAPWHVACLFLNGLPLGMVFGLVLGFLEGRRTTELLAAGLCASFILADGVVKDVGTRLLAEGVPERWMPAAAGGLFVPATLLFVWMLSRVPPPTAADVAARSPRPPMTRRDRAAFLRKYGVGLAGLVGAFLAVTVARSARADFGPEIWRGLGVEIDARTFTRSEAVVAGLVLAATGLGVLIRDNRRAFFASLALAAGGAGLAAAAVAGQARGVVGGFPFMVLVGLGLYLPYVAFHTTVFERLIALTRDRGNVGFLMQVADSVGYLGYVAVLLGKQFLPPAADFLGFFRPLCGAAAGLTVLGLAVAAAYFARVTAGRPPPADR